MTRGTPVRHSNAEACADAILSKVGKDIVLGLPLGLGKANSIANALYEHAARDPSIQLRIYTALTLVLREGISGQSLWTAKPTYGSRCPVIDSLRRLQL